MKKILTIVLASFAMMSCAQKANTGSASNEPAVIKWIEDKPGPSFQQHRTFPTVPDDLWNELGFKEGIPFGHPAIPSSFQNQSFQLLWQVINF